MTQHSAPVSPVAATGQQYTVTRGDAVAVLTELAAGLRLFARNGVALTETYADGSIPPGAAGITLAPWANRIQDGRWVLDGKAQQLDITEVSRNNASHGLLRNTGYTLLEQTAHAVVLEATVFPQHGYPFLVRHRVRYEITEALDLAVSQTLENGLDGRAPLVLGAHPYLRLGEVPTEQLSLRVDAGTRLLASERLIPTGQAPVDGGFDLRRGRKVAGLDLDLAYTDLAFDDGGLARHILTAPDGRSVSLWQDQTCPYVHVFVTTQFPGRDKAVALEPMTGPADAFNSGKGLRWLGPGESFTMHWGITADLG